MADPYHEGKVCDAVLRFLEVHGHTKRGKCWSPEADRHNAPIDLACYMADRLWGLSIQVFRHLKGRLQLTYIFASLLARLKKPF